MCRFESGPGHYIAEAYPQTPAALKSLSDFAGAKSRDRAGALMSTTFTGHIPGPCALKAFLILHLQNPGPGRSADADFKPFPFPCKPSPGVFAAHSLRKFADA